jgi:hypothetical protein
MLTKARIWLLLPTAIASAVFLWIVCFGPQFVFYCRYRPLVRHPELHLYRGLNNTARPLTELTSSTGGATPLSYFGCHFEVPYEEIVSRQQSLDRVEIRFKSGQTVIISDPESSYSKNPLGENCTARNPADGTNLGQDICQSNYRQFEAVISATPSQLSPFQSRRQFARMLTLVNRKGLWFEHNVAAPDIFYFSTEKVRGFETSGLSHEWQDVGLALFDGLDRMWLIKIKGDAPSGVTLTQAQINRIIGTFETEAQ